MNNALVGELIKSGAISLFEDAAKHLAVSVVEKNGLNKVFVDTGEFICGFESGETQLMNDLALVFKR